MLATCFSVCDNGSHLACLLFLVSRLGLLFVKTIIHGAFGNVKCETRLAASDCGQFCLLIMLIMLIVHFVADLERVFRCLFH